MKDKGRLRKGQKEAAGVRRRLIYGKYVIILCSTKVSHLKQVNLSPQATLPERLDV